LISHKERREHKEGDLESMIIIEEIMGKLWVCITKNKMIAFLVLCLIVTSLIPWKFDNKELYTFTNDLSVYSNLGQYISGITSLIAIILIYLTYKSQKDELKETRELLLKQLAQQKKEAKDNLDMANMQRFESVFYNNLLDRKEKIISDLAVTNITDKQITGYGVLYYILSNSVKIYFGKEILRRILAELQRTFIDETCNGIEVNTFITAKAEGFEDDFIKQSLVLDLRDSINNFEDMKVVELAAKDRENIIDEVVKKAIITGFNEIYYCMPNYFGFIKILLDYVESAKNERIDYSKILSYYINNVEKQVIYLYIAISKDADFKRLSDNLNVFKNINITDNGYFKLFELDYKNIENSHE